MSEAYHYKKCLVASLDVLGIKEKLYGEQSLDIMSALHNIFAETIDEIKSDDNFFCVAKPYKFKVFSDNIAIVKELTDEHDINIHLHNMAVFIEYFQARLWCWHQLMSRGGIALGDCFIDDLMVLGPGLVDAYNLESKIAIYPRVILSPSLSDYANNVPGGKMDFALDQDGYMYVDYISLWNRIGFTYEEKEKHIIFVQNCIESGNNEYIKQKYKWMIEKINAATAGIGRL